MATVVFNNNGGAGDGNWSTPANWVGGSLPADADTAQISADCTMDVSDVVAAFIVDAGKTLTLSDGVSLSGFTGNCTVTGSLVVGAGCTLAANLNGNVRIAGAGSVTLNGTPANRITVTNANAGASASIEFFDVILTAVSVNAPKCLSFIRIAAAGNTGLYIDDVDAEGTGGIGSGLFFQQARAACIVKNSYFSNFNGANRGGLEFFTTVASPAVELWNVTFGKDRDNNTQANTSDIAVNAPAVLFGRVVTVASATTLSGSYGRVVLESLNGTRGSSKLYLGTTLGTIDRSTTNPPSGKTYHARLTPGTIVSAYAPLEFSISVPIESGDNISVTAKASRSGDSSDCADVVIDPEGAWFTPTTVAWDLTNADTYYDLPTCAATGAGGTGAKGTVRVVFRMKEYSASQYLDIGDITITCGGTAYVVSMQNWVNGMPVPDEPAASSGGSRAVIIGG